jgi:hypothetical protein
MQGKPATERVGKAGVLIDDKEVYAASDRSGSGAADRVEATLPAQEAYSAGVDVRIRR